MALTADARRELSASLAEAAALGDRLAALRERREALLDEAHPERVEQREAMAAATRERRQRIAAAEAETERRFVEAVRRGNSPLTTGDVFVAGGSPLDAVFRADRVARAQAEAAATELRAAVDRGEDPFAPWDHSVSPPRLTPHGEREAREMDEARRRAFTAEQLAARDEHQRVRWSVWPR